MKQLALEGIILTNGQLDRLDKRVDFLTLQVNDPNVIGLELDVVIAELESITATLETSLRFCRQKEGI